LTPELLRAFEECMGVCHAQLYWRTPIHPRHFALITDASTSVMGSVLQQHIKNAWQPLVFFSKKNSTLPNRCTAPTIASYCTSTRPYSISAICWKRASSPSSPTTSSSP
jgi:hypothetical protein